MVVIDRPDSLDQRIATLERENAKLNKIRLSLQERVERSIDGQGSAFSLFQTASVLEAQIRARTDALERTLADLEISYREAAQAREQAETARLRLVAAIESIHEGFALFDADDRLVLFNQTYLTFWPGMAHRIHTGMEFAEMAVLAVRHKCVAEAWRDPDGWVGRRIRQHLDCQGPGVHALSDGRWMQVNEKRTAEGGIVAIYADITELKRRETRLWEAELTRKTNLLQATLDNIFQGVAVYDDKLDLVAWNNEFVRLLDLPAYCVRRGARFQDFHRFNASLGDRGITHAGLLDPEEGWVPLKFEQRWHNGRVLDIERNRMPDGGFVLTFAEITDRKRTEEALRDGERRIRLITDAMPALIAYVDADECYQFVNEPYRQWLDRPVDAILGQKMGSVLNAELYDRRKDFATQALKGRTVDFEVELTPSGAEAPRYAHVTFVPHIGEGGQILGFFTLMQDITERHRINAAIKEANETLERRVGERTADLTRLNAQLQQEIADRREVEKALQIAKSQAEQANLGKTRFLAAASHDLLQPLNSARLFVSALTDLEHSRQNRTLLDNVDASLSAVEDLLGALLDISKLDAGAVHPEIIDFPVGTLLAPLATEHGVLAQERGLRLCYVPCSAVVRSDIRLLRGIIQNFLTNAIRYTPSGTVLLGCRRVAAGLRIEVWDTGCGIPANQLEEIFEEFRQLQNCSGKRDAGIGLGLAIVRRAARMLDLPVLTRSTEGRGSVFGVTVPLGATLPSVAWHPAEGRPGTRLTGATLLVIDDQQRILAGMQALLSGWGCTVLTAASGTEALDMLRRLDGPPDAVIADYHLEGGVTGIREVSRLRRAARCRLPGIIITADRTAEVQAIVKRHGCWLLKKPVNPAQLRSLLAGLLAEGVRA
jgi:PAS domain S-box-containing protein